MVRYIYVLYIHEEWSSYIYNTHIYKEIISNRLTIQENIVCWYDFIFVSVFFSFHKQILCFVSLLRRSPRIWRTKKWKYQFRKENWYAPRDIFFTQFSFCVLLVNIISIWQFIGIYNVRAIYFYVFVCVCFNWMNDVKEKLLFMKRKKENWKFNVQSSGRNKITDSEAKTKKKKIKKELWGIQWPKKI